MTTKSFEQQKEYRTNKTKTCLCGGTFLDIPSAKKKHYNSNRHIRFSEEPEEEPENFSGKIIQEIRIEMKFCKECDKEIPKSDFYKTYLKSVQTLCKVHSNLKRIANNRKITPKKVLGFMKLDEEVRKNILKDIESGMKLTKVAIKYDIKYPTIIGWRKKHELN
jgi:hypothetical protein